jgi:hypothetical protein
MKRVMTFPNKRIIEIGHYLAEFALEFIPGEKNANTCSTGKLLSVLDAWYDKFIRYAETNKLITHEEIWMLDENPNGLDEFIKEAAINAAREALIENHANS